MDARLRLLICCTLLPSALAPADDWPEWRGRGRLGVWNETGIVEKFSDSGLKFEWRTPIHGGYAGPAVADGRVFVTDFQASEGKGGVERALCLDEKSGKILWTREWPANYSSIQYTAGPRATPTVDGDRVYVLGAMGVLSCLNCKTGDVLWQKDYAKDYGTYVPHWGISGAPLVDGERLICLVGGDNGATVVAFGKLTGKELWRGLPANSEPGYCQPILIEVGGARQLIIWHPLGVASLDPKTGKDYWRQPFKARHGLTVATPVRSGNMLFVSAFYDGPMMLGLAPDKPAARVLWQGENKSEIDTDMLHALICTPVIKDGYIYGVCSYGQFRCLKADTGERVWETLAVTKEHARWATAFIVRHGDKFFINNDRGELMIADLKPDGYHEISRTHLIKPTNPQCGRRELGAVNWTHPAYANRHLFTRNDEEIVCASLEKP